MAYELHILRERPIAEAEWEALARADARLAALGRWNQGEVTARPRDDADLERLLGAARELGGRLEGDDGERYPGPAGGRRKWLALWRKLVDRVVTPLRPLPPCAYRVGDRVRDGLGRREGTVVALRPLGNGVRVVVRYQSGVEIATLVFGAGEHQLLSIVRPRSP